jgi:hypothetical protein
MATEHLAGPSHAPTRRRRSRPTEVLEKDDTELRLEKALFGDDAGFLKSLSTARGSLGKELLVYASADDDESAPSEGDEDLGDVPDEDVS